MLSVQVSLLCPQTGYVEMDEMLIWQQTQDVIKDAITSDWQFFQTVSCLFSVCNRELCLVAVWQSRMMSLT